MLQCEMVLNVLYGLLSHTYCSMLQYVAECCSVLQCDEVPDALFDLPSHT